MTVAVTVSVSGLLADADSFSVHVSPMARSCVCKSNSSSSQKNPLTELRRTDMMTARESTRVDTEREDNP